MFYLNIFLIFSIFGYTYEIIIRMLNQVSTSNLLLGPWMPIYGFGILISEFLNSFLNKFLLTGKKKIIIFFFLNIIILSLLEEIGGLLVEYFFHTSYWNYENIPLNIGPYINILISFLWGFLSTIMEYIILPILTPLLKKIPKLVSYILLILLLLDHTYLIISKCLLLQ